jgi:transposase
VNERRSRGFFLAMVSMMGILPRPKPLIRAVRHGGSTPIAPLLDELGSSLTAIPGIAAVTAMTLLTEIGDPRRFARETQFARWCGTAPIPISSGEGRGPARHHRLDRGGNRKVNSILHLVHVTQARCHPPARQYLAAKTSAGQSRRVARRAHKRHLANVIIRRMWHDAVRELTEPA